MASSTLSPKNLSGMCPFVLCSPVPPLVFYPWHFLFFFSFPSLVTLALPTATGREADSLVQLFIVRVKTFTLSINWCLRRVQQKSNFLHGTKSWLMIKENSSNKDTHFRCEFTWGFSVSFLGGGTRREQGTGKCLRRGQTCKSAKCWVL